MSIKKRRHYIHQDPRVVALTLALFGLALASGLDPRPAPAEEAVGMVQRFADPVELFTHQRAGLGRTVDYMRATPELFSGEPAGELRIVEREQRTAIVQTWGAFADHLLALEAQSAASQGFVGEPGAERGRLFQLHRASLLAAYRFAMDFIDIIERSPDLGTVLNESQPSVGLPANSYSRLKFRYLNLAMATRFAALEVLAKSATSTPDPRLAMASKQDRERIWAMGAGRGPTLTAANALEIAGNIGFKGWFPLQKGVANFMGNVRVWRPGESLISPTQIEEIQRELEPGDILLERREWFLTNLGIPGYWPHAALYIGSPDERSAFFDAAGQMNSELAEWLTSNDAASFEALLRSRYPDAYAKSLLPESGHRVRVLEAIAAGVVFTSLEHSAAADSIAVLRPRLSRRDKAVAILHAFGYAGRPYDYNFDFVTDDELVCSELVYKAYQPGRDFKGIDLPLEPVAGRLLMPANEIARLFTEQLGTPDQQMDFVLMLDGDERDRRANRASETDFRGSWKRPKWHIIAAKGDATDPLDGAK